MCAQPTASPTDPAVRLFDRMNTMGRVDALADVEGRLRLDLHDGDRVDQWFVTVHYGQVTVGPADGEPDCVVDADRALFNRMATGQANGMSALMRADITVTGEVRLLVLLERLLPGPPGAQGPRRSAGSQGTG